MTIARGLALAATPTFALMALANLVAGSQAGAAFCSAIGMAPIGGMTVMYALMSLFHAPPWFGLLGRPARALRL